MYVNAFEHCSNRHQNKKSGVSELYDKSSCHLTAEASPMENAYLEEQSSIFPHYL
jgi:hypothetical protein